MWIQPVRFAASTTSTADPPAQELVRREMRRSVAFAGLRVVVGTEMQRLFAFLAAQDRCARSGGHHGSGTQLSLQGAARLVVAGAFEGPATGRAMGDGTTA